MLEIRAKLKVPRAAYRIEVKGALELPFDSRQKSRLRTQLVSGEEVALMLPRGEILRGGDLVTASDGRVIEVRAASESLLHVTAPDATALARAAYHLGNRHVPVEVGDGYLRLATDHVLEQMLVKLGMRVAVIDAPFEPEAGAYAGGHHHGEADAHGGARIHEYGAAHDHAYHGHAHDHAHHDHDHGACRGHDHGDHTHRHGHDHEH